MEILAYVWIVGVVFTFMYILIKCMLEEEYPGYVITASMAWPIYWAIVITWKFLHRKKGH